MILEYNTPQSHNDAERRDENRRAANQRQSRNTRAKIETTTPRRTRLHHSLTKMICLRRRNGKSDKHLGIKPVSSTRPRKRTTNGLIPAWVRRQPFQRAHVDVLAKPLDNTDLVITRDRAVSSSHEPEKTPILSSKIERSRHHTSPIKPVSPKRNPRKTYGLIIHEE
ncbi:unnamed protein product [Microthlaspi erraticum]|uniref:Uncharacterized protein n=1 Tax=Microthlaspi erraticum TaxID=1685480 RepID=A0A6D2HSZ9_9BRAS|nr:unnamed protein product [Microthlaspi erraticum]